MSNFGATSTADEVLEGQDLRGKLAFITGGASGLGQETARAMAAKGAHVVIAARDQAKLDEAAATIREESGSDAVETTLCDLASLDSVRGCAKEAGKRFEKIDLLINNAGVMACPEGKTADGFEMQFGTNHIGHFLLTNLLMPLVLKAKEAGGSPRVVTLSSRAHHRCGVDFDDLAFERREYEKWVSYGQSKTANALFALALDKRLAPHGIRATSVHPGGIVTNLGRHLNEQDVAELMQRLQDSADGEAPAFKTIPQGAATTCYAATSGDLEDIGGVYLEDCHIAPVDDESPTSGCRSWAADPEQAERLWAVSEEMIGETFAY